MTKHVEGKAGKSNCHRKEWIIREEAMRSTGDGADWQDPETSGCFFLRENPIFLEQLRVNWIYTPEN